MTQLESASNNVIAVEVAPLRQDWTQAASVVEHMATHRASAPQWSMVMVPMHWLAEQLCPAAQAWPQVPQLFVSLVRSAQAP